MDSHEAMKLVIDWGLVVIAGAMLLGVAVSYIRSAFTGKDDE